MESRYSPSDIEDKWYQIWEEAGAFKPQAKDKNKGKPFTIVIPPPNVTGALHMGHALNNTLQDVLIRWKRLQGFNTLWQPGTDHAGIATQSVVERELAKQGVKRQDLGREKFVERVWEWKQEYGDRIVNQLKKLGSSCDWSRLRFTMDEGLSIAVKEVFVRLYEDGLIYQGNRLINWCPKLQTALADEEVENKEAQGHFWSLRYPLAEDPSQFIVVATTRPETLFGDVAVAVNAEDTRYQHLIGKKVKLPLTNREIPIIADEHADPTKGSGAVKITPAHDFNDFEVGKRHNLEPICVMDLNAHMNEKAGAYAGLERFACRKKVLADLEAASLVEKIEDKVISLPLCYRSGDIVEPYLMNQWFVNMRPLAEPALEAVVEGKTIAERQATGTIGFVPERYTKTYRTWLEPFKDWCISRQLWWGHQIPAWYVISETGGQKRNDTPFVVARSTEEAKQKAIAKYGDNVVLVQEEDVLDTWFSSALWPFSTLGWPEKTESLKTFYPTDVLITDRGIIYFWVARMIFSGLKFLDKAPFHTVYIHGTILDEKGQRMSKSKGNGIDPIEMIKTYGADAVRFALMTLTTEGQDIKLSPVKFESGRNFANKLWNAVRFVLPHVEAQQAEDNQVMDLQSQALSMPDRWILSRANSMIHDVNQALEALRFSEAAQAIYRFTWDDFCSRYLEIRKRIITGEASPEKQMAVAVFVSVLEKLIAVLHPFMPFITEEIHAALGHKNLLITSAWPMVDEKARDKNLEDGFEEVFAVVEALRAIRGQYAIAPAKPLNAVLSFDDAEKNAKAQVTQEILINLEKVGELKIGLGLPKPSFAATEVIPGGKLYVALEGILDIEAERQKIRKELEKSEGFVKAQAQKLANEKFVGSAPAQVIELERQKLASQQEKLEKLKETLASLG